MSQQPQQIIPGDPSLLPQIEARRLALEFNSNNQPRSCFRAKNLPTVSCSSNQDCSRWIVENCSIQDQMISAGVCGIGNICVFGILPN